MSVEVVSLGCRLNLAESETMRAAAGDAGELVVVNSCAVTAEAVTQSAQAVRRAARRRPGARIVVTGCAADLEPARFAGIAPTVTVVPNAGKPGLFRSGTTPAGDGVPVSFGTTARAFVGVQTGCDHRCTFCIIPQARGPSRSVPAGVLIDRIAALVEAGCAEVVLTGVDLGDYGADLPGRQTLAGLVERILTLVPRLGRLRLSSVDPGEIDDRLFALLTGEPRMLPHVHLSLQAGDDMVLKRMRRRHTRAGAVATVARLKAARPELAIGVDLIAGFPTETQEQALNSLRLLDDCDIVHAHVFPFSPRAGTPAARMPPVDPAIVRARARALREAADARKARWLADLVGSMQAVLVERADGRGHAGNFAAARLDGGATGGNRPKRGDVVTMRVARADGETLIGEPA